MALVIGWGCGAAPPPAAPPPPSAPSQAPPVTVEPGPEVEDFEKAAPGSLPAGWRVVEPANGFTFEAAAGDRGTLLKISSPASTRRTGASIKRALDAARYRGMRVLVAARASCQSTAYWAVGRIGVDVSRPGPRGAGDRVRTEEISRPEWTDYQAVIDVAPDATAVELVISGNGALTCQIDDLSARILGAAGAGDEPPRALAGRALDNVVALARLYGLVRYFHPSDEAAALDDNGWARFLVRGVRAVEGAPDAAALVTRLQALFAPIAPAVAIGREGEVTAAAAAAGPTVSWSHDSVGLSKGGLYKSTRGVDPAKSSLTITMAIDPASVRGKELVVKLRARGDVTAAGADAGLWIAEQRADRQLGFYTEPEVQPAVGATWTEIVVRGRISDDAAGLRLGVQVLGGADVWLEPPVATADGKPVPVAGWGTAGPKLAATWRSAGVGFLTAVGGKECDRRRACLHASPTRKGPPDLRPWTGALGGGVAASVPLALGTKDGKTVPPAAAAMPASDPALLVASDRATRLAAVIIAWNIFQHFYPYFDVRNTDWMPVLPRALGEAALDEDTAAMLATLRRLVHELHDGHGGVWHPGEDLSWMASWLWERVEGKLVITQVSEQCKCDLAPGDVVVAIDGVPTEQVVAAVGAQMSASTEQHLDHSVLRRLRAGPEGGRRALEVRRQGATVRVEAPLVEPTSAPEENRPAAGDEIAPGIRYADIGRMTEEQWAKIVPDLAAARGVIIDMRGYPGFSLRIPLAHATKKTLHSAQWNIPRTVRPDREAMTFLWSDWQVPPALPHLANVVFLTDGRAVSAAETFMGIVEHFKLGPIVGGATAGTNGNVNPFMLPGGYLVWWTGMKVLKHDGSRHHGIGIQPTVRAARTIAGVAAQRDEVLEKGIEVAQQRASARRGR